MFRECLVVTFRFGKWKQCGCPNYLYQHCYYHQRHHVDSCDTFVLNDCVGIHAYGYMGRGLWFVVSNQGAALNIVVDCFGNSFYVDAGRVRYFC